MGSKGTMGIRVKMERVVGIPTCALANFNPYVSCTVLCPFRDLVASTTPLT